VTRRRRSVGRGQFQFQRRVDLAQRQHLVCASRPGGPPPTRLAWAACSSSAGLGPARRGRPGARPRDRAGLGADHRLGRSEPGSADGALDAIRSRGFPICGPAVRPISGPGRLGPARPPQGVERRSAATTNQRPRSPEGCAGHAGVGPSPRVFANAGLRSKVTHAGGQVVEYLLPP
jgi:hypothetical protein